jgi:hypothetical protein
MYKNHDFFLLILLLNEGWFTAQLVYPIDCPLYQVQVLGTYWVVAPIHILPYTG